MMTIPSMKTKGAQSLTIVSNITNVPTIYADGAYGATNTNGVIKINLIQTVQDYEEDGKDAQVKNLIVARLAMSPETLYSFFKSIRPLIKHLIPEPKQTDRPEGDTPT